jgi:hypothetical protein
MLKDTVFTNVSPNVTALHCCHANALSTCAQTLTAFPLMTIGACTVIVLPLKILTSLTYTILLLLATSFTFMLMLSIFTVLFVIFMTSSFLTRVASAAGKVTKAIIANIVAVMPNAAILAVFEVIIDGVVVVMLTIGNCLSRIKFNECDGEYRPSTVY